MQFRGDDVDLPMHPRDLFQGVVEDAFRGGLRRHEAETLADQPEMMRQQFPRGTLLSFGLQY